MDQKFTIEQYKALCDAIAQGTKEVEYGDKKVVYRVLDEMLQAKALMESYLFPNQKKRKRKYFNYKSGF